MTDLEMTTLCAEAMGLKASYDKDLPMVVNNGWDAYNPLHDDAQAMALVKKLGLTVSPHGDQWEAEKSEEGIGVFASDLNRAIVECVAKMWKSRTKSAQPTSDSTDSVSPS